MTHLLALLGKEVLLVRYVFAGTLQAPLSADEEVQQALHDFLVSR